MPDEPRDNADTQSANSPAEEGSSSAQVPLTQTPAAQTPAAQTPVAQTLAAQTPAAQTPATQTPATQTPATQTPAAQTPAPQTPATQTLATQMPAAQTPATQTSAAQTPAAQTPAAQTSAAQTPAAQTPATQTPAAQTPVTQPPTAIAVALSRLREYWPYVGMAFLALFFCLLAFFLYKYAIGIGYTKLGTIEGTRPLLVIAAIMSTIAFGGALLIGSLFSSEGTFEERFRHAREIFLVFSGVFGTVIGFYFGAGETKGAGLIVSADLQETAIVAYVTGGTPPYKLVLTYGPDSLTKSEETKTGWVRFQLDKEKDNIRQAQVTASDSKAAQNVVPIPIDPEKLKSLGWKLP